MKVNSSVRSTDCYQGEYINDKKCGQGIFRWASGAVYSGEYFDDQRFGYGEMYSSKNHLGSGLMGPTTGVNGRKVYRLNKQKTNKSEIR